MTGLFNIHTVLGSLSPKQREQEERAVCFLPVESDSSSKLGGSQLASLLHLQMVVSCPQSVSGEESAVRSENSTYHYS